MNYVYKIKHKFLKSRKDGSMDIEEWFHKATAEDQEGEETVYYINYRLPTDSPIVRGWVKIINDVKWQKEVKLSENLADYEKEGLFFKLDETNNYVLDEERTDMADFELVKVGFTMNEPELSRMLFITTSNGMFYYGSKVLDENVPDIIEPLIRNNVIYKALAPGDKARRQRKVDNRA